MEQFIGGQAMPPVGMPPVGGNPMQTQILSEVLMLQQQISNSQQALDQRIARLENNASQQFTNLVNQVQSIRSVRLSHEKKQIEFDSNVSGFDKSRQFNGNQHYNQE